MIRNRLARAIVVPVIALFQVLPIAGQDVDTALANTFYPFGAEVESSFERGLDAWDRANYNDAFTAFQYIISAPENRRTTAAMLMAGRALVAMERYGEASGLLRALKNRYPESRYAGNANDLLEVASYRLDKQRQRNSGVFELGVLLPMDDTVVRYTRSLFTGIRIAVDDFNSRGGREIRIIFEDTGLDPVTAREAARRLIERSNPSAIIGPLFSEGAIAVAEIAEQAEIPLLVPLATDGAVALNRSYVFQANPTYEMRGRMMARYAVRRLRHTRLGVIADSASFAGRMADAFVREAIELGATVPIRGLLTTLNDWYEISDTYSSDQLSELSSLYIPVSGENAAGLLAVALDQLDQAASEVNLLGNGEWSNHPDTERLTRHHAVYGVDFSVDSTLTQTVAFDREFRRRLGRAPDQPAFVGYDVTRFLVDRIESVDGNDEKLADAFHESIFQGLGIRIDFSEGQINQSLFFLRME